MQITRYPPKTGILKTIETIWKRFGWFVDQIGWISGVAALLMTIAVMREVIGRYLFNSPSDWSLELSGYLVVAISYLALATTQLADGHIAVDMFYIKINKKVRNYLDIFIRLVSLTWTVALLVLGWQLAGDSLLKGSHSSQSMMWPLFPSQVLIPIGCLLMALVIIGQITKAIAIIKRGGE